jgi:hypothetical protein
MFFVSDGEDLVSHTLGPENTLKNMIQKLQMRGVICRSHETRLRAPWLALLRAAGAALPGSACNQKHCLYETGTRPVPRGQHLALESGRLWDESTELRSEAMDIWNPDHAVLWLRTSEPTGPVQLSLLMLLAVLI